jgi:hypothetical protein
VEALPFSVASLVPEAIAPQKKIYPFNYELQILISSILMLLKSPSKLGDLSVLGDFPSKFGRHFPQAGRHIPQAGYVSIFHDYRTKI